MGGDTLLEMLNERANQALKADSYRAILDSSVWVGDVARGEKSVVLDGDFHLTELKALVAFMESKA